MSINNGDSNIRPRRVPSDSPSRKDMEVPLLEASFSSLSSETSHGSFGMEYSYISTDKTAEAIQQCERFILNPYSNALKLIGWLPFSSSRLAMVCQSFLVILWFVCIVATMVTQIFSCFKRDAFVPGKNVVEIIPASTVTTAAIIGYSDSSSNTTSSTESPAVRAIMCHEHIVSSLLLHDLVVIAAYFFGVYLFSRGETEYLFGLASHVFIKNAEASSSSPRLIKTIGILFICGLFWLVFSLFVRVMTAISVQLFESDTVIVWPYFTLHGGVKIALLVLSLFGFFTFDMVYMFSIMNYVTQGELNIYLLWDIRKLIELRKHDDIDGAIKDTQKCKQYLDVLNGKTATLTALTLFVLGSLALATIIDVDRVDKSSRKYISEDFQILAIVSAALNGLCWILLFMLPFIQAARVTYWCEQLKDISTQIRGRVFAPYNDVNLLDLDSFLSYLQSVQLRATIFGVPVYPWLIYLIVVSFCFTMLVLFQLDAYSIVNYI